MAPSGTMGATIPVSRGPAIKVWVFYSPLTLRPLGGVILVLTEVSSMNTSLVGSALIAGR